MIPSMHSAPAVILLFALVILFVMLITIIDPISLYFLSLGYGFDPYTLCIPNQSKLCMKFTMAGKLFKTSVPYFNESHDLCPL